MATTPTPPGPVLPPSPPVVYLKPPPDWEEHEKPSLPGSPSMPLHQPAVRAAYGLIAVLVALTGGLGNALFTANLPTIQGQMGLTSSEAAWLTGAYVMLNMTGKPVKVEDTSPNRYPLGYEPIWNANRERFAISSIYTRKGYGVSLKGFYQAQDKTHNQEVWNDFLSTITTGEY